jgi:hypothetical protein
MGVGAGREPVEHGPQREDVAARVVARAEDLLRRDVGAGAHGHAELLGQEVGQVVVVRQAEIDQDRLAAGPEDHVGGLQVQVDHVLAVDVVERERDRRADPRDLLGRQRRPLGERRERGPLDQLHHDVGLGGEVAGGDVSRNVRPAESRQDHLLDLEADDRDGIVAVAEHGDLHDHRESRVRTVLARHAPERGHAPGIDPLAQAEAVDEIARSEAPRHAQLPSRRRWARRAGSPAPRTAAAAASQS